MKQNGNVKISISDDYESMSTAAADFIEQQITSKPDLLLCAATGSSPTGMYQKLAEKAQQNREQYTRLRIIKLDEWSGLAMDNPATCEYYVQQHVVNPLQITSDRYTTFESDPGDIAKECERINVWLHENGPIDLCILGIGSNGHLALNEPSDTLVASAHPVALAEESKQHTMLDAAGKRVEFGLTLGIGQILCARTIVFLANGQHKKAVVDKFFESHITTRFPASFLHLHPNVHCFFDKQAFTCD